MEETNLWTYLHCDSTVLRMSYRTRLAWYGIAMLYLFNGETEIVMREELFASKTGLGFRDFRCALEELAELKVCTVQKHNGEVTLELTAPELIELRACVYTRTRIRDVYATHTYTPRALNKTCGINMDTENINNINNNNNFKKKFNKEKGDSDSLVRYVDPQGQTIKPFPASIEALVAEAHNMAYPISRGEAEDFFSRYSGNPKWEYILSKWKVNQSPAQRQAALQEGKAPEDEAKAALQAHIREGKEVDRNYITGQSDSAKFIREWAKAHPPKEETDK